MHLEYKRGLELLIFIKLDFLGEKLQQKPATN
jgi:hypothetical protein